MAIATGECKALYEFEADEPGELAFVVGEVIITTEKINNDWMSGKIGDREGLFPLSLVKVVKELVQPSGELPNGELVFINSYGFFF